MGDAFVFVVFCIVPLLLGYLLHRFFRKSKQHTRRSLRGLRLAVGNLLVFFFLFSVLLLGGEVYYRYVFDTTDSFGLSRTTEKWRERHYQMNGEGVRDSMPSYEREVPAGKHRVTFLGDSFTAGHGVPNVEDRFANLVRAKRPTCDVHVLAKNGWDTGTQLQILKGSRKRGYELDVVVLVYCLNDVSDIMPEWQEAHRRIFESSQPGFWASHSFLLNQIYFRWKAARDPDVADYYQFVLEGYEGAVWEEQQKRFKALRNEVGRRGGRLLVVTFPFLHQVGPDYKYRHVHARLAESWDRLNVPHLDLLSLYEPYAPADLVVNSHDAHPNERAHAMAADAIARFIDRYLEKAE